MARQLLPLLAATAAVLATLGPALATAQSCIFSTDNKATVIGISSPAGCVMLYNSNWKFLGHFEFSAGTSTFTTPTVSQVPRYFELYSNKCNNYINKAGVCTQVTPTAPAPTTPEPSTLAPTTPEPSTPAPSTPAPSTPEPTTPEPTTPEPTTPEPSAPPPATVNLHRGMYYWGDHRCLIGIHPPGTTYYSACYQSNLTEVQERFFFTVRNPHRRYAPYNHVYLEMDLSMLTGYAVPALQSFLQSAHERGIAIEVLIANASWVLGSAETAYPISVCEAVRDFNADAPADARVDGVHLDIEPHTLPNFNGNRAAGNDPYNDEYENNLLAIMRACTGLLADTGATRSWAAAMFYERWATDLWGPLVDERLVDYVTMMNYVASEAIFVNGTGVSGGVNRILASLQGTDIRAVFAADCSDPEYTDPSESYWDDGSDPLESLFSSVGTAFQNHPNYWGVATNSYSYYVLLQPVGPPVVPICTKLAGRNIEVNAPAASPSAASVYTTALHGPTSHTPMSTVLGRGPSPCRAPQAPTRSRFTTHPSSTLPRSTPRSILPSAFRRFP